MYDSENVLMYKFLLEFKDILFLALTLLDSSFWTLIYYVMTLFSHSTITKLLKNN